MKAASAKTAPTVSCRFIDSKPLASMTAMWRSRPLIGGCRSAPSWCEPTSVPRAELGGTTEVRTLGTDNYAQRGGAPNILRIT